MTDSADTPSPPSSVREPHVVDEPFNDTTADVILRTSDKVDFYVYKNILSLASPFFKDMFCLPQSKPASDPSVGDGTMASHPIVDVSEDARTMDLALRFCYPMRKPTMTELKDVGPVLLAACKYDMDTVFDVAKVALAQCIQQDILGAFALAFRCELYGVCSEAAVQFIQCPFLSLDSNELDYVKADGYHQLLRYHQCHSQKYLTYLSTRIKKKSSPRFSLPPWNYSRRVVGPKLPSSSRLFPPAPQDADVPFHDKAADIILRSSDQIDFHTHSVILSFASPVFKDMILSHQKADTGSAADGNAGHAMIINVPENSHILNFVLRRCYPAHVPPLTHLNDAHLVLAAGVKYDIDVVRDYAATALIELVDQDILGVLSIALRYRLNNVCAVAAKRFVRHPQISLDSPELGNISARQYHELLRYHTRCGEAAAAVVASRTWFDESMSLSHIPSLEQQCNSCYVEDSFGGTKWYAPSRFWKFLNAAKTALMAQPCSLTVLSELWASGKSHNVPFAIGSLEVISSLLKHLQTRSIVS